MIIADAHEPEKYRRNASRVENMEVVDYLVIGGYKKYVIERKTVDDLVNSRNDGRLWRQLEYLTELSNKEGYIPLLVVVGNWGKLFRMKRIRLKDFYAIQVAIAAYRVCLIGLTDERFFLPLLKYLDEKAGKASRHVVASIPKPRDRTLEEERVDVLCAVNGVGEKTAKELLNRFKTVKGVVSASRDELGEVLGRRLDHFLEVIG